VKPPLERLTTPALLVRMDRVRANVARMVELLGPGGIARWRPHVKTAKLPPVLDVLLASGVRRFKCATTREAAVLLERGSAAGAGVDLLVALAHRGPNLARLAELARAQPRHRVALLTEDPAHARDVRAAGAGLGLFVDVDPGYGRSGIPFADRARVAATVAACGPALRGLHCYDGHVRDAAPAERARRAAPLYYRLLELADSIAPRGLELVTSGTPTFVPALAHPFAASGFDHQVSPGTVVYWDTTSQALGIDGFRPAVHVLARVISSPGAGRVTADAGSKALDAAAGDPCCAVDGWPGLRAATPSEEHLPLQVLDGAAPAPGTLLQLVPRHVCPTVNLADQAVLVDGDDWLGIVPVAARGHETLLLDGRR
jgi:D-serine deaminase-like pyridoxal phosphate-dependent protein